MRLVKGWRERVLMPVLICGYMETLRRATFYSFGFSIQGTAFTAATVLIILGVALNFYLRKLWVKAVFWIISFFYFSLVVISHLNSGPGFYGQVIYSLPPGGSYNAENEALLLVFIFIVYGILLYLVAGYIMERKDITELTAASALLLGVEIVSSRLDISLLVILHILFILLLRSNAFYLYLLSYPEFCNDRMEFGKGWVKINAVVTLIIVIAALLVPVRGSGLAVTSRPVQWVKGEVVERVAKLSNIRPVTKSEPRGDTFHLYWDRLENFELQGTVGASDEIVMSVKSSAPFYWRGESADFYTGSGWKNSFRVKDVIKSNTLLPNPYGENIPVKGQEQTFTLAPDLTSTVIFTANAAEKVDIPGGVFWSDEAGNYYTEEMKSGFTYKVVSYVPEFTIEQLRKARTGYGGWVEKYYLQLPADLPARIRDKALEITKGLVYPYDKARAIEGYLSENYPYTLEVKLPGKDRDIVDYFLFDLKEGYCTYHSTAMIVMLRSIGIPARWVKGFATGTFDVKTGTYMVKEGDAHAWVEVYFGEYGWIPFDPTPSFHMPAIHTEPAVVNEENASEPDMTTAGNMVVDSGEAGDNGLFLIHRAIYRLVFLVTTLVFLYIWHTLRMKMKANPAFRARDYYLDLLYLLENRGYSRFGCQTPYEFAARMGEKLPGLKEDIALLTEGYLREQYGNYNFSESEFRQFRKAWEKVASAITGNRYPGA